jgi:glutaredoxin
VIFAALLGAACAASAQMYRWTDDRGRVHVTDTPPPPSATAVQRKSFSGGGTDASDTAGQPYALQVAAKSFPVTLYTARDCDPCGDARKLLNSRGVPFREVLVVDEPQQQELRKVAGALAVPSVTVGSNVQKGFEESAYHSLLDIAGYPKAGILTPRSQAEPKPAPPPAAPAAEPADKPDDERAAGSGPYAPGAAPARPRSRK